MTVKSSAMAIKKRALSIKKYSDIIVENITAFCMFMLLRQACGDIGTSIALGLLGALLYMKSSSWTFSVMFILSASFFGGFDLLVSAVAAVIITPIAVIYKLKNKNMNKAFCVLILILSQIFLLVYKIPDSESVAMRLLGIALSVPAALCCVCALNTIIERKMKYIPATDELICLSILGAVLTAGLQKTIILSVPLTNIVIPFSVLILIYIFGGGYGTAAAAVLGAGAAAAAGNLSFTGLFVLWAVAALAFMKINRILSVLSLILVDGLLRLIFFNSENMILSLITVSASAVMFLLIPSKALNKAKSRFSTMEKYSSRHIINRLRGNLSTRLYELSDIFFAMQLTFKSMVRGVMPVDKAKIAIAKDVCEQVCHNCPERLKCWRIYVSDTEETFIKMVESAIDRGKASILDINNALAARCGRINSVLAAANTEVYNYKQYYTMTMSADNSKILIAEQMAGVSQILKNLSHDSRIAVTFDTNRERALIDELLSLNILCKEAVFYDDSKDVCVALVLDSEDTHRADLSAAVSKASKINLMIDKVENTDNSDWKVVHFMPRPEFDVEFGFKSEKKTGSEISGDTHSFLKIAGNKFLLALCDGMGSGKEAEEASSRAVSLVENFYKAGFDSDTILSSVNRLLATANDELFTALDISVIDLKSGIVDFIKIGAPYGMIKQKNKFEFIEGGSLPMGVLEEMRPVITKKALNKDDYIYMFTDGVEMAFGGRENLGSFISQMKDFEPQAMADAIIMAAMTNSPKPKDDMTVIVAKVV